MWEWRDRALDAARAYLRDTGRLWSTYLKLKPEALAALDARKSEDLSAMRAELDRVHALFSAPISDALRAASVDESTIEARVDAFGYRSTCGSSLYQDELRLARERLEQAAVGTAFDPGLETRTYDDGTSYTVSTNDAIRILQWRLRREGEGGQALVATYARIITDLRKSLPETKARPGRE
jgi:hypothetical protein